MKHLLLLFALVFAFESYAQVADYKIMELAEERAAELSTRLELDPTTEHAMARIFYKYDYLLSDALSRPEDVSETLRENRLKKQEELKKILNPYDFQAFLLFSDIEQTAIREDYHEFFSSILSNEDFLDEFLKFELEEVLPVISHFHDKLTDQMRVSDYNTLLDLQGYLFDMLDTIDLDEVLILPVNQRTLILDPEHRREVIRIMELYSDEYASVMNEMAPYQRRWDQKTEEMLNRYYSKGTLESVQKQNQLLAKVGLAKVIDEFQFFMLVPYDEEKYIESIELKHIIQQNVSFNLRSRE